MSDSFTIKQSDDAPILDAELTDPDGNPVDLTGADVEFHMAEPRGGPVVVEDTATVVDETAGRVRYVWSEGDTSQTGRYRAEFEVTFANGDSSTYPNVGYETVLVDETIA